MTDAAVTVTQTVVEEFTESYLRSIGCTVEKSGQIWEVEVPEGAKSNLPPGTHTLVSDADEEAVEDGDALHPESSFFLEILDEASNRAPVGGVTLDAESTDIVLPGWLQHSDVQVEDAQFTPYYDGVATVILFRITVETVSEYQQEFLQAVAVDTRSKELLPNIDETVLQLIDPSQGNIETKNFDLGEDQVESLVHASRELVIEEISESIDKIHQEASRAADSELEDYRRMQEQREEELEKRRSNLHAKIEELNEAVNQGDQQERVQALKQRKEKKSELETIETELGDLRRGREQGFPEQQKEIRERHALEVIVSPVTVTQVEYERGEIELQLTENTSSQTMTVGYGSGVGVTDEVRCSSCDRVLSRDLPLGAISAEVKCERCA